MRVAFITPSPPYPLNAGNRIRTFHLLNHVGEHHDVTLLTTIAGIGAAENEWNPWKKALIAWQSRKALRAEIPTYRFFDRVAVVSEVDRTEVERSAPGLPTSVVPNGVDAEWFAPSPAASDPDAMVFTGVMDWLPNVDGITFFVTHVLPRIRRVIPRAELTVVGRDPSPSLVRRLTGDGVRFTGTVQDVRPHVARARLVVVP